MRRRRRLGLPRPKVVTFSKPRFVDTADVTIEYLYPGGGKSLVEADRYFVRLARRFGGKDVGSGVFLVGGVRDITFEFESQSDAGWFHTKLLREAKKDLPGIVAITRMMNHRTEYRKLRFPKKKRGRR